jgi:hypothetical protein
MSHPAALLATITLAAAALIGCDPTLGTAPDPPPQTITAMRHYPKVTGHWGKITYTKKRECWAIWYRSALDHKIHKRCVEAQTYRKYRVGMDYHG